MLPALKLLVVGTQIEGICFALLRLRLCRLKNSATLEVQNICLLLKLLHKLYTATQSSWAIWVRQRICLASLEGDLDGNH